MIEVYARHHHDAMSVLQLTFAEKIRSFSKNLPNGLITTHFALFLRFDSGQSSQID
jgi:hypothetical protein